MSEEQFGRWKGLALQGFSPNGCLNLSTSVAHTIAGSTPSFCLAG